MPGSDPVEISVELDMNSHAPKIKQLEKEVEALKVKQKNELELALSKLEATKSETGIHEQIGSGKINNLQILLWRNFRITGMISPHGQKEQLSFMSSNRQLEDGLGQG